VQIIGTACMTIPATAFLANALLKYVCSKSTRLTALRANPVFLFTKDETPFPVLEWSEADDTTSIAIFHIDPKPKECERCSASWLMHSFVPSGEEPEKSRLNWSVSHMSHIPLLFTLAQHLFGVLQWSNEDIGNIYCDRNFGDSSDFPEYVSLFPTFVDRLGQRDAVNCWSIISARVRNWKMLLIR